MESPSVLGQSPGIMETLLPAFCGLLSMKYQCSREKNKRLFSVKSRFFLGVLQMPNDGKSHCLWVSKISNCKWNTKCLDTYNFSIEAFNFFVSFGKWYFNDQQPRSSTEDDVDGCEAMQLQKYNLLNWRKIPINANYSNNCHYETTKPFSCDQLMS